MIGAVVAEFVAGTGGTGAGLAYEILQAGFQINIPRLFAALVLISLTGVAAVRADGLAGASGAWRTGTKASWHDADISALIRGAAAILTGQRGAAARAAGPDIRIRGSLIDAIGTLHAGARRTRDRRAGLRGLPGLGQHPPPPVPVAAQGRPGRAERHAGPLAGGHAATAFARAFDGELFRLAVRIGLLELALCGCGTVADHHYLSWPGMPFDRRPSSSKKPKRWACAWCCAAAAAPSTRLPEANRCRRCRPLQPETLDDFLADIERLTRR